MLTGGDCADDSVQTEAAGAARRGQIQRFLVIQRPRRLSMFTAPKGEKNMREREQMGVDKNGRAKVCGSERWWA